MKTPIRFRRAMSQAHKIKRAKQSASKRRHIAKWCEMVREAIRGTDYESTGK